MLTLTTVSLILTLIMTALTAALYGRLRATEQELERTQRRMARLDELADKFAAGETDAASNTWPPANHEEEPRTRHMTPAMLMAVVPPRDAEPTRRYPEPTGLQFDSEALFGEDRDFAAPRMAVVEEQKPKSRQKPARPTFKTPVGSPRKNTPRSMQSIVAVGSIQVRSDEISRVPED